MPNLFAKPAASTTLAATAVLSFSFGLTPVQPLFAAPTSASTRIFISPSLLQLTLAIYLLEGENKGYTSYDRLISSTRKNVVLPKLYVSFCHCCHGNTTIATLSTIVNGMEMAGTQAPPAWDTPDGLQVIFTVLPLYHSLSLHTTSFFSFLNPSMIVMPPVLDIDIFFDSVPKYHITTFFLVPSLLHQLVHHLRFKNC
ncbi:uncharacterized protein BJ212DRAFT_1362518 [Suillus subaureus]|uniref:AMP-dependent synthetase/ligase domain-containing protein n=1 Tax=Suillus subaureus TaxID=48587 RepID=A0A9P7E886_9AGAM|nr:uncharacterized protein BJ212DRAFT_1362518 [Suillus subaureus]KAG1814272.1 hypothetical protein BJ212DRAFT_1362518 [Suillus subaureus]